MVNHVWPLLPSYENSDDCRRQNKKWQEYTTNVMTSSYCHTTWDAKFKFSHRSVFGVSSGTPRVYIVPLLVYCEITKIARTCSISNCNPILIHKMYHCLRKVKQNTFIICFCFYPFFMVFPTEI